MLGHLLYASRRYKLGSIHSYATQVSTKIHKINSSFTFLSLFNAPIDAVLLIIDGNLKSNAFTLLILLRYPNDQTIS